MPSRNTRSELDELLPYGLLATRQWLTVRGMTRHRLDNAIKSGKLVSIVPGVVARPGLPVTWQSLAASLLRMWRGSVYVGGMTALAEAGLGHYMQASPAVHLYSDRPEPGWVKRLEPGVRIEWHSTRRLWAMDDLREAHSLRKGGDVNGWQYQIAAAEQAYMEILADVPEAVSFEHADLLMQGLTSLSPRRLDALLKACRHVKVKRLFFFFAERHRYAWFDHLDRGGYDLGSGKRMVAQGGRLDTRHLITVPETFHGQE